MDVASKPYNGTKKFTIFLGDVPFYVHAKNENEAAEVLANYFVSSNKSKWYFDAIEVECMAQSVGKTIDEFIQVTDLRHCPKHNIYLPKCKIEEEKSNG